MKRIGTGRRCGLALLGLACVVAARSEDWPRWRGPNLDGVSREEGLSTAWPKEGPTQLWEASVGIGFSSVAVAGGRVFTLGNTNATDTVWSFEAATGRLLWNHSYPCSLDPQYYEGGPGSTPTVDGERLYTFSKRGHVFCFEAATGKVLWQKNLMDELGLKKPRWGFAGSPLILGPRLLLNAGDAGLALDKADGRVLWKSGTEPAGYATPVPVTLAGEPSALLFAQKALIAVQVKDGRELWRHPWVTKWDVNAADPIVVGDRLYLSSFDRGGALLRLRGRAAPEVLWEKRGIANHFNSCVHWDGYLYGIDGNTDAPPKDLRCVELATGQIRWQQTGFGLGSVFLAGGKLMVLGEKGELAVAPASPAGFKTVAQAQVLGGKCWTVPVLSNGRLYCRNAAGRLVCLDLRDRNSGAGGGGG